MVFAIFFETYVTISGTWYKCLFTLFILVLVFIIPAVLLTIAMAENCKYEKYHEDCDIIPRVEQTHEHYESAINDSADTDGVIDQQQISSFWVCLKVCVESTIFCGVFVGLFGTFLWWLELNVRTYCLQGWKKVRESIHDIQLIVDIVKAMLIQFWAFLCIVPICDWSTIKKLKLFYICAIGAFLDAFDRLLLFIFMRYSKRWQHYIGNVIFLGTSFTVCYLFARHCIAARKVRCQTFVLTMKLNLQFICGMMVSIPFILVFLNLYYDSPPTNKTILVCAMIIFFAIPKLLINQVITNIHGICKPGDEITLAICYLTGTTLVLRLMQAKIEQLSYFVAICVVHGLLNVIDKLSLPLRRKILSCMCKSCAQARDRQLSCVNESAFLANLTLISIITETTSVIFSSAEAYLITYYYKKEGTTGERYNGFMLFQEMVIWCSIAVGIELVFNVIAVKIQTNLYSIPVIIVWERKWKSIIIIHMVQVFFIVLYFSEYLNDILLRDKYKTANATCFGFFERI